MKIELFEGVLFGGNHKTLSHSMSQADLWLWIFPPFKCWDFGVHHHAGTYWKSVWSSSEASALKTLFKAKVMALNCNHGTFPASDLQRWVMFPGAHVELLLTLPWLYNRMVSYLSKQDNQGLQRNKVPITEHSLYAKYMRNGKICEIPGT